MTDQTLCVGERVQLNSGGPTLTVQEVRIDRTAGGGSVVTVTWIGGDGDSGRYGKAEFPVACLRKKA